MLILVLHEILALNFNSRQTCIYITAEFLLYCICLRNLRLIVSQRLTNFFFFSILSCPLSFFSFNLSFSVYISSRSLLLGLSLLSLSLCLSLSLLSVFLSVHTLYTLSANAAGNRTLCDLCQAKYQRKQTRHRERKMVEHEAAEELDGTREHRKREQLSCRPDLFLFFFFFFFTVLPI